MQRPRASPPVPRTGSHRPPHASKAPPARAVCCRRPPDPDTSKMPSCPPHNVLVFFPYTRARNHARLEDHARPSGGRRGMGGCAENRSLQLKRIVRLIPHSQGRLRWHTPSGSPGSTPPPPKTSSTTVRPRPAALAPSQTSLLGPPETTSAFTYTHTHTLSLSPPCPPPPPL